jgi:peptidoglycan/xylan/chitin deacetylase (PgdA/CDA1 family)
MRNWNLARSLLAAYLYDSKAFVKYVDELLMQQVIIAICDHNPSPEQFKKMITWLKKRGFGYSTPGQVSDFLDNTFVPEKSMIWYTLDDGWIGNFELLSIVEEEQVPITLFVSTEPIQTGTFPDTDDEYAQKSCLNHDSQAPTFRKGSRRVGRSAADRGEANRAPAREALTTDQLRILADHPLVTIGAHTHRHRALTDCSEEQIRDEISNNISYIEEYTGNRPVHFAFPYGLFDEDVLAIVKTFEFESLATISKGIIKPETNRFALPRNIVLEGSDKEKICRILNFWYPLREYAKKTLKLIKMPG